MYNVAVSSLVSRFRPYEYDLNVVVLIHFEGRYRKRLDFFKRFGLCNPGTARVHVTLLGSLGDAALWEEILSGWPSCYDVSFLEMSSDCPVPKINGFYLWLRDSGLRARWHLRVDDDSITDIRSLLEFTDSKFRSMGVHLMASPSESEMAPQVFSSLLHKRGLQIPTGSEYEASMTSGEAFERIWRNPSAMRLIEDLGKQICSPGDRVLAFAARLSLIPTIPCPVMTKDFERHNMSLARGQFAHVHYVDWSDAEFILMLGYLLSGVRKSLNMRVLDSVVGSTVRFGRCIGSHISSLRLRPGGLIAEGGNRNEYYWEISGETLLFLDDAQRVTTVFDCVVETDRPHFIMGPFLESGAQHFIEIPSDCF